MIRPDRPACELIRRALGAIVASETFGRSERLRSFLSYIVENELAGKAAHLKGYSVGIDVFGRPPGFDAGNDPLVRVQAGKLRKLLEQYYETEGAADRVRIRVPLGSYVPEYTIAQDHPIEEPASVPALDPAPPSRAARQKSPAQRSWRPAPVSSPLALLSLLPLIFLGPSIYPDPTNAAITNAQITLSTQSGREDHAQAVPRLHVVQCWPAGGRCSDLARAISNSAGYHKTVRLLEARETAPHPLSYSARIENRSDGHGIYVRLIHEQSGSTIYARHFSREQVRSDAGIAYEAVAFSARAFAANGPLYRHAIQAGAASSLMECLAHMEQGSPAGTPLSGPPTTCTKPPEDLSGAQGSGDIASVAH